MSPASLNHSLEARNCWDPICSKGGVEVEKKQEVGFHLGLDLLDQHWNAHKKIHIPLRTSQHLL